MDEAWYETVAMEEFYSEMEEILNNDPEYKAWSENVDSISEEDENGINS